MSANRTGNCHVHRKRHLNHGRYLRKLNNYLAVQSARLTAIIGVTSVTEAEIIGAHATPQSVRARYVRGATTAAEVTALGINIA